MENFYMPCLWNVILLKYIILLGLIKLSVLMFKFLFNWIFILSSKWVGLAVSFGDLFKKNYFEKKMYLCLFLVTMYDGCVWKKIILNLIFIYIVAASLIAQLVKNPPVMQETPVNTWVRKMCWRRDRLPTPVFLGFPSCSVGKESTCNVGDLGSTPGLGRSSGEGKGLPIPVL